MIRRGLNAGFTSVTGQLVTQVRQAKQERSLSAPGLCERSYLKFNSPLSSLIVSIG
jgi:hypothetical protein